MNDTPGWASPGSTPSDRPDPSEGREPEAPDARGEPVGQESVATGGGQRQAGPVDAAGPAEPADPPTDAPAPKTAPAPHTASADPPSKWSKQQPQPAPWSMPGGQAPDQPPPPAPGPGWGGQAPGGPGGPGWGGRGPAGPGGYGPGPGWGGWQGRPPAAKPGIIPLRPLGAGEILDGAVSMMRMYWRTVLGISLTVAVVTQLVLVLLQGLVLDDTVDPNTLNDRSATLGELVHVMRDALISSGAILVVTLLGVIIATALLTTVTSRAVLGRSVTLSEAWREARPQVPRLFGLTLLLPLIVVVVVAVGTLPGILIAVAGGGRGGTALAALGGLAGAIVALWLAIRFALASPALMLERQGVLKSLSRSAKLVKGSWWRVLGIQMLATVIANIVSSIILIPFTLVAGAADGDGSGLLASTGGHGWTYLIISAIGSVIGSTLTFPVTAGVAVLLYIDQRIRREALDLELARAAGVQDYGSEAPGAIPGS